MDQRAHGGASKPGSGYSRSSLAADVEPERVATDITAFIDRLPE